MSNKLKARRIHSIHRSLNYPSKCNKETTQCHKHLPLPLQNRPILDTEIRQRPNHRHHQGAHLQHGILNPRVHPVTHFFLEVFRVIGAREWLVGNRYFEEGADLFPAETVFEAEVEESVGGEDSLCHFDAVMIISKKLDEKEIEE